MSDTCSLQRAEAPTGAQRPPGRDRRRCRCEASSERRTPADAVAGSDNLDRSWASPFGARWLFPWPPTLNSSLLPGCSRFPVILEACMPSEQVLRG